MKAATWGQTLLNSTYKGHLEQSNVQKQKVECQLPGARGGRNRKQKLTGTQSLIRYENVLKLDIGDGTCTNCISIKLLFFKEYIVMNT